MASAREPIVAEDPNNEGAWSELDNFLLDNGDPRGAVVAAAPNESAAATTRVALNVIGSGNREAIVDALSTSALLAQLHELHLEPSTHTWQLALSAHYGWR